MILANISQLVDFSFLFNQGMILNFLQGIGVTLLIAFFGILIGIVLGLLLSIGKLFGNKVIMKLCSAYITFVRCTPMLVQLFIIHFIPPFLSLALFNTVLIMNPFLSGILTVGLNSAAYVAEIFRGGLNSVDKGQYEAAESLGFNKKQVLQHVIVPQAVKNILPSLGNEFVVIIKETSIVSIIGARDIMFYTNQVRNTIFNPFPPLIVAALIYFVLVYGLIFLLNKWEAKLKND